MHLCPSIQNRESYAALIGSIVHLYFVNLDVNFVKS